MSADSTITEYSSISELTLRIQSSLRAIGCGVVEGEIRRFSQAGSGHCYFELADADNAVINAVMWRGSAQRLEQQPKQGDLVRATFEKIDFYPPGGRTQIIVTSLASTGEGELLRRRLETLKRLTDEGLTDPSRKKPLARFPRRIGVIAGAGSDAQHDVVTAIRNRFTPASIVLCPALVQGVSAPGTIIDSLATLSAIEDVDVIIVARGGGSVTDLAAFDDEGLCRAIFACGVPVITSIGHTKDRPVCDYVADAWADVPAKAAEFAIARSRADLIEDLDRSVTAMARVREQYELLAQRIDDFSARLTVEAACARLYRDLDNANSSFQFNKQKHQGKFSDYFRALDRLGELSSQLARQSARRTSDRLTNSCSQLHERARSSISRHTTEVRHQLALLDASDVQRKGLLFAQTSDGILVRSIDQLRVGESLSLNLIDGSALTTIDKITKPEDEPI